MGDLSAEPSMEEILSSIKRIIAEEGDGSPQRGRRPLRTTAPPLAATVDEDDAHDEVLELSDPMPTPRSDTHEPVPRAAEPSRVAPAPQPAAGPSPEPQRAAEPIVGREAAAASRGALEALSRVLVKPEPGNDGTLEGMVREMLRPMLREWLDANLPELVETLVSREIARIVGQAR
ncbi:DUF2497 domain-containing protein [uncultured Sphingomonas sp.]|uniref:DUF2497 domain-containing protein n=1 Tax=uncultured Sphingomonas sp. TaxID=158754 RepID=UPI0035CBE63B